MEGFVPLSRRFFEHAFWQEGRAFSKAEAWVDLIQMAGFRDYEKLIGLQLIRVERGWIVASERFLSLRWKWSRTKVRDFLALLQQAKMVTLKKDQGISIITLCNFEQYNVRFDEEKPQKDQEKTAKEPGRNQEGTKENKVNKENKEKEETPTPFPEPDPTVIPNELQTVDFWTTWQRWMEARRGMGKKPKNWNVLFCEQLDWLRQFGASVATEIIKSSIRNGYQGLFEPKTNGKQPHHPESNMVQETLIARTL